jgi:hypothetical protein
VEFTIVVTNNSLEAATLDSLNDDVYGDLNGMGTCAVPQGLAPSGQAGDSYSCSFSAYISGVADHKNIVTAVASDNDGNSDTATDDATVETFAFAIDVTKYVSADGVTWADANSAPGLEIMAGSKVYWKIQVANDSERAVGLTWEDVRYGSQVDLTAFCEELPASLAAGGSYSCEFMDPEAAKADQQLNTVTVYAAYGSYSVSDSDPANYFGVAPEVTINKQVSADDGATWQDHVEVIVSTDLWYRFVVKNTGNVPLSDVTVTDPTLGGVLCSYPTLGVGQEEICGPVGPVTAKYTGEGNTSNNTATAGGCYRDTFCDDDQDTASYTGLYWAFTPGFWKNHGPDAPSGNDAWQFTAYYPPEDYALGLVFANAGLVLDESLLDMNLLEALPNLKGGKGLEGAGEILLRAAIASLLNASFHEEAGHEIGPDGVFPYTSAEIIAMVNAAIAEAVATEDRQPMLDLAYELDQFNNGIHYIVWP